MLLLSSTSTTAAYGLASAASWGTGDFSGGLAARRANVFLVIAIAHLASLAAIFAAALALHEVYPGSRDMLWGAAAGIVGGLALAGLYRALSVGTMSIAAPVTAVLAAAIPVLYGAFALGMPGPIQMAGFVLAMVSILLLSFPRGTVGPSKGLGLAVPAGIGFGLFFLVLRQATGHSLLWPLVSLRLSSSLLMMSFVAAARSRVRPPAGVIGLAVVSGIFDLGGNLLFVVAAKTGRVDVASVLASLYPGTTVLLARLCLKERVSRMQAAGIAGALLAVAMIAA